MGETERGGETVRPKSVERLARAATRLMTTFERRTEVSEDIIDAIEVLKAQRDLLELHYLTPEAAHEASQGAYLQAAHLEWEANNNLARRSELIRRAHTALAAADKLRALGFPGSSQSGQGG